MNSYPELKYSGVDWIGNIPKNWKLIRAKYLVREVNDRTTDGEEMLLSVSEYYGVKPREEVMEEGDFISRAESLEGYKKCKKYDLIMNIMLAWKKGLGVTDWDGIVSPSYCVFRTNSDLLHPRYLHYLLRTDLYITEFRRNSTGIIDSRLRLYPEEFLKIRIIKPPINKQKNIAIYLDKKIKKFDNLIQKKQKMIELLKEERSIIVNKAVKEGLNPNIRMKDSGIDGVGKIPNHWDVKKIKYELDFFDHKRIPLSSEERGRMENRIYDYYGASGVIDKVDDYLFDDTLILIAEDGANLLLRNLPLAFIASGKFWVNNHAHILKPKTGNIEYFVNILESLSYQPYITGAAQPKLSQENLGNILIPIPPLNEQKSIMNHIKRETKQIDKTIIKIDSEIKLLEEFRATLISEVVTGKIDVRNEM